MVSLPLLVIIYDLNVFRVRASPAEARPELIVYADAVLPGTVAFQGFQSIARWDAEVVYVACLVQLLQFPARHGFEVDEACHALSVEQGFGVGALERLDHGGRVTPRILTVKRDYWLYMELGQRFCPNKDCYALRGAEGITVVSSLLEDEGTRRA